MDELPQGTAALPIVLVVDGQDPAGVVTRLCVQASRVKQAGGEPLQTVGAYWLDETTRRRWHDELIPHVRSGLRRLNVGDTDTLRWRVGLRLPDAAALSGRPCRLEGASADACFLVLIIASALGIGTRASTLLTGTVHLDDGRLGLVGRLPEKLLAAAGDHAIRRFVHPPIDRDGSGAWTPEALLRWDEACHYCDHRIKRYSCTSVAAAVRAALSVDSRVVAALRHNLIEAVPTGDDPGWVSDLLRIDDARWLQRLDRRIHSGHKDAVQVLLDARLDHAIRSGSYPVGIGNALLTSLQTVPIGRRRERLRGTLISTTMLSAVAELARDQDQDDLSQLTDAVGHTPTDSGGAVASLATSPIDDRSTPEAKLSWLIENHSEYEAAQRIDRAIDEARLTFRVEVADSWDGASFIDLIASFYAHLCRSTGHPVSADPNVLAAAARNLAEQAWVREGGFKTALANARDNTQGGVRRVLDTMADTYKAELRRGDAQNTYLFAIDENDLEAVLAQTRDLIQRFGPLLPKRFQDIPPEFLVGDLKQLVGEAVLSRDRLAQHLRYL